MKGKKRMNSNVIYVVMISFIVGLILLLDELYMFGIPFGMFLPDMSSLDNYNPILHHWMVGVAMMLFSTSILLLWRKKK